MSVRMRFWIEAVLAAVATACFVLTLISREWIEIVFGVDPDESSGSLEWMITGALLIVAVVFIGLARAEWRRPRIGANQTASGTR